MLGQTHDHAGLDAGPRAAAPGMERLCVATGKVRPAEEMIRFVLGPDGALVPDLKRRLPGRGVWVTATRAALGKAIARKAFGRAFKREIKAASDLVATTEHLLERAALEALAMCRKAGRAAIGFGNAEAALARAPVRALVNAADAAAGGTRKLMSALRRRDDAADIAVISVFTSAQLDLAFGRSNVVHAALLAGPECETFLARVARLDCFRTGVMPGSPGIRQNRRGRSATAGLHDRTTKHGETPEN